MRNIICYIFLLAMCFSACTPKSKLVSIVGQRNKDAIEPSVVPEPGKTISKKIKKTIVSKKGNHLTPPTPIEGKLIQTGGCVGLLARELAIDLDVSGSNVSQIVAMQRYVNSKWHYIHDPKRSKDTWRSAEATIALRYKDKFPGDCDDFAILMASLAKQIGLRSRMIGGFYGKGGHAFAEFRLPANEKDNVSLVDCDFRTDKDGCWVSLDWFKGAVHNRYIKDIRLIEEE